MSAQLLPCPFCGGEAAFESIDYADHSMKTCGCHNEDCIGYQSITKFATKREAAKAWNTRTPSPAATVSKIEGEGV